MAGTIAKHTASKMIIKRSFENILELSAGLGFSDKVARSVSTAPRQNQRRRR